MTTACQEAKVLEALQYDIESPCIVHRAMHWFSAPTRRNNSYLNDEVIVEKYNEAVSMAFQSAVILPSGRMNTPRSCSSKIDESCLVRVTRESHVREQRHEELELVESPDLVGDNGDSDNDAGEK